MYELIALKTSESVNFFHIQHNGNNLQSVSKDVEMSIQIK